MKRVNLIEYFELAESLSNARRTVAATSNKGSSLFFALYELPEKLGSFINDDNGFTACKHVAGEILTEVRGWINRHLTGKGGDIVTDKFDEDFHSWQYGSIATKIDAFKSVFGAECRDVDVYSVGQISIYKTSALVSDGANVIPREMHKSLPNESLEEFNNAGKCLAFDLTTACGFHALRGLELVMDQYLKAFGVKTSSMKSWNDYIRAAEKIINSKDAKSRPSAKVAAMLDRLRELERNPLMHPRDTLDQVQAGTLFSLCAITVVEMVRDQPIENGASDDAGTDGRKEIQRHPEEDAQDAA